MKAMKLYTVEYQQWNAGAPGGLWFALPVKLWALSVADAVAEAKSRYGDTGSHYRAGVSA